MDKKICLIYTGGTIGMLPTDKGYAPVKGWLSEALKDMHDLAAPPMPQWELIEFDPLLDSSNVNYIQWNLIAETIRDNYDRFDGFVVLHGTDTMSYSASALSFMLENLNKPVVFTGSQIPLCEIRSDGRDNLITSMLIAADGIASEVSLFFGHQLLRGNRSVKTSADGLIAFDSPGYPPLASAGIEIEYNVHLLRNSAKTEAAQTEKLHIHLMGPSHIIVLKLVPGMNSEDFAPIIRPELDALVLETFGTGNIPNTDNALPILIEKASASGITVIILTQCIQGTVRLEAYETSSRLNSAGAFSGLNMTTEACVAKLNYLFSSDSIKKTDAESVRRFMTTDFRGELNS